MEGGALAGVDHGHPAAVDVGEFLLVLNTAAAVGKIFLVEGVLLECVKCGLGGGLRVFAFGDRASFGKSLGLLFGGFAGLFVFFELSRELGAADKQLLLLLVCFVQSLLQSGHLIAQRVPRLKDAEQSMSLIVRLVRVDGGARRSSVMCGSFVLFL